MPLRPPRRKFGAFIDAAELRSLPVRIVESVSAGPSSARNDAAAWASGEWRWFIDADAWPADRRISAANWRLEPCFGPLEVWMSLVG